VNYYIFTFEVCKEIIIKRVGPQYVERIEEKIEKVFNKFNIGRIAK
jgi:hypothetical protein